MKKIWQILIYPYTQYKDKKKLEKRIAELRKRDPFIYK